MNLFYVYVVVMLLLCYVHVHPAVMAALRAKRKGEEEFELLMELLLHLEPHERVKLENKLFQSDLRLHKE